MAYNNPKASGTDMLPALVARLAELDGIVAVKECSGDARRIAEILNAGPATLRGARRRRRLGARRVQRRRDRLDLRASRTSRRASAPTLHRLCSEGSLDAAREIHGRLLPLGRLDMKPKLVQYFKAAMDIAGREGGPSRPPRLELTAEERSEVEEAVRALGAGVAG